ncbi:hypothetical protein [Caballeronia ptereochthonis]|uniref:Uncharacterized protein n=1 Tax=Caballeronia ptereochthonis TaxID=1777144 RepID=A0A158BAL6_9BURK|nr:hypothetical protein [Caballeronia ptereochthonis]SAK67128.1 hypothetical protein AWB83_03057 [Caballeronia ptereochthonis]
MFVSLWFLTWDAHAQPFVVNARAARFAAAVVMNDFHTAQAGGGYVFSYESQETEASLAAKLDRWFSGADPHAIAMEPAEKQALFGFYWAGSMMPATSACFRDIADPGCRDDLSPWMARELDDDPRFVRAYESARDPLGLPPLAAGAH